MLPVILAGGTGSRLWPLSRQALPKQFLKLNGDQTMLQATIARLNGLSDCDAPLIICNEEHRFLVAEQLRTIQIQPEGIMLEPFGRNTAPAIAMAALKAKAQGSDPVLMVLAADHLIQNQTAFQEAVETANHLAVEDHFVTFGVVPSEAHTGYGYIQCAPKAGDESQVHAVVQFVEKPDLETAKSYFSSGKYLWNSGMFAVKASVYLNLLGQFAPDVLFACEATAETFAYDLDFTRFDPAAFAQCPDISVDYALAEPLSQDETMKQTNPLSVVSLDAGWSDVGSWSSLWEVSDQDEQGNSVHGDTLLRNVENSYVYAESTLVSMVGVSNLIVVQTKDAILIANKDQVQDVKAIVNQLKVDERPEYKFHREVFRPWGSFDSIDKGDRYQVKRISVKPGEKLSVQMHHHRAEHWIVVSGTAKVTNGEETFLVTENESTYIPIGQIHALENPGCIPLEMIEVQSGSYLGEDDIVRFQDLYGRVAEKSE